jgi:hypothetical protein
MRVIAEKGFATSYPYLLDATDDLSNEELRSL